MIKKVGEFNDLMVVGVGSVRQGMSSAGASRAQGLNAPAPERKGHFELKKYPGASSTMVTGNDSVKVISDAAPNPLIFTKKRPFVDFEWILKVKARKECKNTGTIDLLYRELSPVDDRTKVWAELNAPILDARGNVITPGDSIPSSQVDKTYLLRAKTPDEEKWDYWMYHENNNPKLGVVNSGRIRTNGGSVLPVQTYRLSSATIRLYGDSKADKDELSEHELIAVPPKTKVVVKVSGDADVRVLEVPPMSLFNRIKPKSTPSAEGSETYVIPESDYARVFLHEVESLVSAQQRLFKEAPTSSFGVSRRGDILISHTPQNLDTTNRIHPSREVFGGPLFAINNEAEADRQLLLSSYSASVVNLENNSQAIYELEIYADARVTGPNDRRAQERKTITMAPGESTSVVMPRIIDMIASNGGIIEYAIVNGSEIPFNLLSYIWTFTTRVILNVTISIDSVTSSVDSPPKPVYVYRNIQYVYK